VVNTLLGECNAKQFLSIPLFNDAVYLQISVIAEDLNKQLVEKIRNKPFAVQRAEARYSAKDAYLITSSNICR
jgi:hypothetical protein